MDRLRRLVGRPLAQTAYQPIEGGNIGSPTSGKGSWIEYFTFLLLGVAMLWAWNMFLAGAPYFQARFSTSDWLLTHFQPGILTVSTVTSLGSLLLLAKLQRNASYPKRITASLTVNIIVFTLLALSTVLFQNISPQGYFVFLMLMVFLSSLAAGLCQNGVFAFVSGFGVGEYTQAIMIGQGVAGVLPCVVQIVSVLSVRESRAEEGAGQVSPRSAFAYFMTATVISAASLLAVFNLVRRRPDHGLDVDNVDAVEDMAVGERKVVGLRTLFVKLKWLAMGVFVTFAITMVFPVFAQEIESIQPSASAPRILQHACFIPLAFLLWNTGDLLGRMAPLVPGLNIVHAPKLVFFASLSRVVFIPLYLSCNIRGRGAVIQSDVFYLLVVQLLFGMSNGYLGSICMMGASEWVETDEREAAGGFMGLMLVGGLSVGSLLSFAAASV